VKKIIAASLFALGIFAIAPAASATTPKAQPLPDKAIAAAPAPATRVLLAAKAKPDAKAKADKKAKAKKTKAAKKEKPKAKQA
jgi:hypothetical protein